MSSQLPHCQPDSSISQTSSLPPSLCHLPMCSEVSFTTITGDHFPMSRYFAVTHGRCVQVWDAPGHSRDFAPFSLLRSYPGQYDNTTCIEWSEDSRCVHVCVYVCVCVCVCVCVFESLSQQLLVEKGGRELVHCTLSQ